LPADKGFVTTVINAILQILGAHLGLCCTATAKPVFKQDPNLPRKEAFYLEVDKRDLRRWIWRIKFGRLRSLNLRGQREQEGLAPMVSLRTDGGKMLASYIISGVDMELQIINDSDQKSSETGMTKVRDSKKGPLS